MFTAMPSFFGELKRRNVVRVAILYAIVGWLVLQIAALVIPALKIPDWGVSLVVVLVVLGFPVALVLAWAYELTPDGIRPTQEVEHHESITHLTGRKLDFLIIGVLAAALAFVVIDSYVLKRAPSTTPTSTAPPAASAVSLAVLPFADMSDTHDQDYLTDGMSEEVLNMIAQVEGFKVTGRTSAFAFKGRNEDLRVIGQKLNVENILEGSVRKQGDRIRVTAQLVKAADGYHLWSETYDRKLDDVFAIQDEIAQKVVAAIRQTLGVAVTAQAATVPTQAPPTRNLDAYTHFLRGQYLLRLRTRESMQDGLTEFEKAVELDPLFGRAHAGIAGALALQTLYVQRNITDVAGRANEELELATRLDPAASEVYAIRALLIEQQHAPLDERIPLYEKAVAGNPSDSQSMMWLADCYGEAGRTDDQIRMLERAYAIDPLSPILLSNYAMTLEQRGDSERAEQLVRELEVLQPDSMIVLRTRSTIADIRGQLVERIRLLRAQTKLDPEDSGARLYLVFAYAQIGDSAATLQEGEALARTNPGPIALSVQIQIYAREDLRKARELVEQGQARYPNDFDIDGGVATFYEWAGDYAKSLDAYLRAVPAFKGDDPNVAPGEDYFAAADVAFLYRQLNDEAHARALEAPFRRTVAALTPPGRVPRGLALWGRARMYAAMGERAKLLDDLRILYDNGEVLPAWVADEPLFRPYRADPEVIEWLQKFDARRSDFRRALAAEAL
jgi:TolB-like protein/Flp pilus assembly protein TadD